MDLWERTVETLQTRVAPYDFTHWIRPIRCDRIDDARGEIHLAVPDDAHERWLQEHFLDEIHRALRQLTTVDYRIRFTTGEVTRRDNGHGGPNGHGASRGPAIVTRGEPESSEGGARGSARPDPGSDLVERYRFETFVDGPNSRFALSAARAVAERPGDRYNPMFIYGGVGLGKTHLLHAIGHGARQAWPDARVRYVTSESYVNDLISAIRNDRMDLFRSRYRDESDVLLIDDIQFIAGKDRTQEEFFHTFNTLHSSKKQIVVTSDQVPQGIPDLEERLRSRLQWGLIADIKPPGFETRVAIVERKAESDGLELPSDVAMLLARHITHNVRELEGALMRLGASARVFGQPITVELARQTLGDVLDASRRRVAPTTVMETVAREFELSLAQLKGPRRHRHLTVARQLAMYLVRELTDTSLPHIGQLFGGRDHSTVMYALKRVGRLADADPEFRQRLERLRRDLTA